MLLRLLLLTLIAVTTAHAEWPFHRVKKAVALTPSEHAYLQEQSKAEAEEVAQAARIESMNSEVNKRNPAMGNLLIAHGTPSEQEEQLRKWLELDQWRTDVYAAEKEVNEAQTLDQAEAALKTVSNLETKFAAYKKQHPQNYSEFSLEHMHPLPPRIRYSLESKITEIKRKTEADYCLSHCETATTPEEIEASIPHASWFGSRDQSEEDFKKFFHKSREELDADFKKRMMASSKEDRVRSIKRVINSENEWNSIPAVIQYKEKRAQMMAEMARIDRESALVSAAQEANRIAEHSAMQQHSDAMLQQQAAMQQHLDAENASWRQHEDALYAQPVMPPPSTPYHSGTIYFNNGNAASYGGY